MTEIDANYSFELKLKQAFVVKYCGRKMNSWILLGAFQKFSIISQTFCKMCVCVCVCLCVCVLVCVCMCVIQEGNK